MDKTKNKSNYSFLCVECKSETEIKDYSISGLCPKCGHGGNIVLLERVGTGMDFQRL